MESIWLYVRQLSPNYWTSVWGSHREIWNLFQYLIEGSRKCRCLFNNHARGSWRKKCLLTRIICLLTSLFHFCYTFCVSWAKDKIEIFMSDRLIPESMLIENCDTATDNPYEGRPTVHVREHYRKSSIFTISHHHLW